MDQGTDDVIWSRVFSDIRDALRHHDHIVSVVCPATVTSSRFYHRHAHIYSDVIATQLDAFFKKGFHYIHACVTMIVFLLSQIILRFDRNMLKVVVIPG